MATANLETQHASAERTEEGEIRTHFEQLQEDATLSIILDAMPHYVAVLDENRQVVAANTKLVETFGQNQLGQILGQRSGELLNCQNSKLGPGGCGTSEACRTCGAVNAIISAQKGIAKTDTCQLNVGPNGDPLDLMVTASPVEFNGRSLTILSVQDMADENRRKVLERTFFHDVLNAAGGASGIANVLNEVQDMDEVHEFAPLLVSVTEQLIDEIHAQRDMLAAERGDLTVQLDDCCTGELLKKVRDTYTKHPVAEGRTLELDAAVVDKPIRTSKVLFQRVLGNMAKNALEATATGGTVRMGFDHKDGHYIFWVNNPAVMPQATQLQVFNRSFSTKGTGRGIGTYSIRLLGEKYLGGQVSFDSFEGAGTTFRIQLPPQPAGYTST
jgi:signal transduction histidine kinase